ncbi:allophanate hydrolase [Raineyella fluvialis]|uniref:Allophanate hydrolase n=1 Tax=Raineyella fluvialis TaxID=2662261 RepID=A0A5Q2FCH8_9ACTN|nr:allophanate hydrolase [Raineyella fluvialis]QGF23134.1 allophanate hydrolase [Raineyella fluvialis]
MTAVERAAAALDAIASSGRPEIWISLADPDTLLAQAAAVDARVAAGEELPLAGSVVAVKDNIDVAGLPTTAGCPAYAYDPAEDAEAVARLRAAGAVLIGKTNLDQFATGLVGTRSPYGAVRNAWDPSRVSGGSSSGSAVAVALGLVDLALGTDTAGSGRVPAALNGIVGIKPTRGLVSTAGVVPACRSLDCVTVFARSLDAARTAVRAITGDDQEIAARRIRDRALRPAARPARQVRLGVPFPEQLGELEPGWREAYDALVTRCRAAGAEVVPVDLDPFLEAAGLLYDGAFVAERFAAVGPFIARHRDLVGEEIDPTVAAIVLASGEPTAADLFDDLARLEFLAVAAERTFADVDALLTPTTTRHPTIEAVRADPVAINAAMGRFTNYANLLDMASIAFPAGTVSGLPFGAMLTAPAGADDLLAGIVAEISRDGDGVELVVVGAHLSGMPLNHELTARGGVLVGPVRTGPIYRLYALATTPAKPGLVRVRGDAGGASVVGELWRLPVAGLGHLVAGLPRPMTIGSVELEDGRVVPGFLCEPAAVADAEDITAWGGWRSWVAAR